MANKPEKFITTAMAAAICGLTPQGFYLRAKRLELDYYVLPGTRGFWWKRAEVEAISTPILAKTEQDPPTVH